MRTVSRPPSVSQLPAANDCAFGCSNACPPRTNLGRGELHGASVAELFIYAMGGGDDDPAHGLLRGVIKDLDALAEAIGNDGQRSEATIRRAVVAAPLSTIVRRLEVVDELLERAARDRVGVP